MTVNEFLFKFPNRALTLRYFVKPEEQYNERQNLHWRAAFSGHYRITDGMQMLAGLGSDDRVHNDGWGSTPDEAVTDLYEKILKESADAVSYHSLELVKAQEALNKIL